MDNDVFDCIRRGKAVYHAANICPHCGLELYPEDEETPEPVATPAPGKALRLHPLSAITLGTIIALMITVATLVLVDALGWQPGSRMTVAQLVCACLGAFAGGYGATAVARTPIPWSALITGTIPAGVVIILGAVAFGTGLLFCLAACAASLGGAAFCHYLFRDAGRQSLAHPSLQLPDEEQLYQELLQRAGYDRSRVERLIAFEQKTSPQATRQELIKWALVRLARDYR